MIENLIKPSFILDLVLMNEEDLCFHPSTFILETEKATRTEMAFPFPVAVIPSDEDLDAALYCPICGRCYEEASERFERYLKEDADEIYI